MNNNYDRQLKRLLQGAPVDTTKFTWFSNNLVPTHPASDIFYSSMSLNPGSDNVLKERSLLTCFSLLYSFNKLEQPTTLRNPPKITGDTQEVLDSIIIEGSRDTGIKALRAYGLLTKFLNASSQAEKGALLIDALTSSHG